MYVCANNKTSAHTLASISATIIESCGAVTHMAVLNNMAAPPVMEYIASSTIQNQGDISSTSGGPYLARDSYTGSLSYIQTHLVFCLVADHPLT